jgi:hypothetical protein
METMSSIVSVISVAVALAATLTAWRLRVGDQARQKARIAALSAAIGAHEVPTGAGAPTPPAEDEMSLRWFPEAPAAPPAGRAPAMFTAADRDDPTGGGRARPAIALGALAGAVALAGALVSGGGSTDVTNAAKAPAPLELLALRHEQRTGQMTVSGLVRNPAGAQPVRHLAAVVFLFDSAGGFVASSRAPVDFTTLAPGEESPFTITLSPAPATAARYRVSFRRDDSGILPHVDRREKS